MSDETKSMWKFLKTVSSVLVGVFASFAVWDLHMMVAEQVKVVEMVAVALYASWLFLLLLGVFNVVSMLVFTAITKLENRP